MKCWHCNSDVIWQNDFSFEDYGYTNENGEEEGIVTVLSCSNCPAQYEITLEQ